MDDPQLSLSPFKRPRSLSHEQEGLTASSNIQSTSSDLSVEVEIVVDGDELELGESCGQAKMRGRAAMPECDTEDGRSLESAEWEYSGTGSGSLEEGDSSYLGREPL